ncbi:hypothetical protein Pelo_14420 [Pelomyxa schiedti]|nr:hypothetical protein Pelo_14420 [Pelomyxa schiedti]
MEAVRQELIVPPRLHDYFKLDPITKRWAPAKTHTVDCVLAGLYIGDLEGAFDTQLLEALGITHVLSVLQTEGIADFPSRFPCGVTLQTIQIPDDPSVNIVQYFPAAIDFISKALRDRHTRKNRHKVPNSIHSLPQLQVQQPSLPLTTCTTANTTASSNSPSPPTDYIVHSNYSNNNPCTTGGGVLVHCHLGMSRSVTIVTAFVMYALSMDWLPALRAVQREHPTSFPSLSFARQLAQWGHHLESTRIAQQALRNSLWGSSSSPSSLHSRPHSAQSRSQPVLLNNNRATSSPTVPNHSQKPQHLHTDTTEG